VSVSHLTCDVWQKKRNISICQMYAYTQTHMCDTSYEKYWGHINRVSVSHLTCDVWQKKWNISICQMHVYTQTHMCDTSYEKYWWLIDRVSVGYSGECVMSQLGMSHTQMNESRHTFVSCHATYLCRVSHLLSTHMQMRHIHINESRLSCESVCNRAKR